MDQEWSGQMTKHRIKQWNFMYKLRRDHIQHDSNKARLDLWMDQLILDDLTEESWKHVKSFGKQRHYNWTQHLATFKDDINPFIQSYPKLRLV